MILGFDMRNWIAFTISMLLFVPCLKEMSKKNYRVGIPEYTLVVGIAGFEV